MCRSFHMYRDFSRKNHPKYKKIESSQKRGQKVYARGGIYSQFLSIVPLCINNYFIYCGQIVVIMWAEMSAQKSGQLFRTILCGKQRKKLRNPKISKLFGGDKRDRTADLLNAIQALSQLSYTPIFNSPFHTAFVL